MNYRDYKIFYAGGIYHVYNRGVAKSDIFLAPEDYSLFLWRLKEQVLSLPLPLAKKSDYRRKVFPPNYFELYAYCLMPNHFHLLIKQLGDIPVSELLLRVMTGYSKVFNGKYERVGSLFQDQFKAVSVESDSQLLWLSAYIHQNPLTAGLVADLHEWAWSSYHEYAGVRKGNLVNAKLILGMSEIGNTDGYKTFVSTAGKEIALRKDLELVLLD